MHRFFLTDKTIAPGDLVDLEELRHQLWRVLRMRPGDRIKLLDGSGREFLTELLQLDERQAVGRALQEDAALGEPTSRLTLYQCALKGDRLEWVWQKGTELGVYRFVPVISDRTIVRSVSALSRKHSRWQAIVREAAEQSGRGRLPQLAEPLSWDEALDEAKGIRLVPWERADGELGLGQALVSRRAAADGGSNVSLLVGPEGGLTDAELQIAVDRGWQPVSLGRRILRAETAAVAAMAISMSVMGEMG